MHKTYHELLASKIISQDSDSDESDTGAKSHDNLIDSEIPPIVNNMLDALIEENLKTKQRLIIIIKPDLNHGKSEL